MSNPYGNRTSLGDRRSTPTHVFNAIQKFLNFQIGHDVCAEHWSAVCPSYWTEGAFEKEWPLTNWMNPPYSNPTPWVKKAFEESQKGKFVVGLVVDDRSTKWWQDWVEDKASVCLIPNQRISFIRADTGEEEKGNPKASAIPIWTPWVTGRTEYVRISI